MGNSQGWRAREDDPETPSKLSAEAAQKAGNEHRRALLRKAREAAGVQRSALVHAVVAIDAPAGNQISDPQIQPLGCIAADVTMRTGRCPARAASRLVRWSSA